MQQCTIAIVQQNTSRRGKDQNNFARANAPSQPRNSLRFLLFVILLPASCLLLEGKVRRGRNLVAALDSILPIHHPPIMESFLLSLLTPDQRAALLASIAHFSTHERNDNEKRHANSNAPPNNASSISHASCKQDILPTA